MQQENLFLLHALQMGVFVSFLYDILRIYRRLIPHGLFWVSVEDLFFWSYCSVEVFLLMHREGNGNLRWFAILGAMLGMGAYLKLVSPWLIKLSLKILEPVVRAIRRLFRAVGRFLKKLLSILRKLVKGCVHRVLTFFKNKLTVLFRKIRMKLQKHRDRKRGARDGSEGKRTKKARVGRRQRHKPKEGKDTPQAS